MIGNLRSVENLEFSPDGKLLVGGGGGLRPELWDMAAGHLLPEHLEKQRDRCEVAVFSPDGKLLAAVYQHTVYLWDVATGKAVRPLQGHEREVSAITFAPDGMTAVSVAGETGVVRRWMVATGQELPNVGKVRDMVYAAAYSPDGRFLAAGTGNHDGTIWLLDAITGQEIRRLVVPGGYVTSIAISADSKTLVSRAFGREIHVWDVESGRDVRQFPGSPQGHMNIALSPDGHTVADGDQSGVVHLWETATGKELRHFDGHREIATIAFSPNGRLLASGGGDEVRLWDSTTGKELRQLAGHKNWVQSVAFSPDGRTLVSVGVNQPVRIWEVASGKERRRYEGHHGGNRTVTFSRDGRRLATGGDDTTVLVWDVTGLAEAGSLPRLAPTPEQLTELWADLAHEDAARAGRAIWSLVAGAERAMPFLRDRLRPVTTADRRQTARWIADLDSNTFAIRQTATRELEALGESSGPALAEVAKSGKSAEVRQRAEQLLQRLRDREGTAEGLRELRAVEVLEQIGTSAARKHLEALAGGAAGATLTGAAAEALQRLQAR
jgi:WD40 repeat protein